MSETARTDVVRPAARPSPGALAVLEPRVVFTHRGDPLVPYLGRALRAEFDVVAELEVGVSKVSRALVGAVTVRSSRARWGERYIKSELSMSARSRNLRSQLEAGVPDHDVVFQTHGLYRVGGPRTVMYVDCTHRQSVAHWPAWNPLRGQALRRWLAQERQQYHAAAHVFTLCRATRDSLVDDYGVPADRVTVAGAGLDYVDFPSAHESDPAAPVLLFVGNDFRRKGGPELLAAFDLVRAQIPSARLQLVGSGCPAIDRPGVEVIGPVDDRRRLSELYAGATAFCLPSHFEPFGLVLLEAMAHGLPCVATDSCGIPDIVVDGVTGSLVPEAGTDLVDDLARALLDLLRDPAGARAKGEAGRRRVREHFLWSHVVQRMRPTFEALASRSSVHHHANLSSRTPGGSR